MTRGYGCWMGSSMIIYTPYVKTDDVSLGLEDCLAFFSGANSIPAAGFDDIIMHLKLQSE